MLINKGGGEDYFFFYYFQNLYFLIQYFIRIMNLIIYITAAISCLFTFISVIVNVYYRKMKPHSYFILQLLVTSTLSMISLIVNVTQCNGNLLSIISAYLYLSFNQTALAWLAIICFAQFYVITSNQKTFLHDLSNYQNQFTIAAYLIPAIPSFIPTILTLVSSD